MTSNSLPKKQTLEQILTKKSHEIWGHFLTIEDAKNCVKEWLQQKHEPIQPFNNQKGYTEDEWRMREIARQCQIEELLDECK